MPSNKSSNVYDIHSGLDLFYNNCLKLRLKDNDYKELSEYLNKDNINNMFVVSLIMISISLIKCICRFNNIGYSDAGVGMFFISIIYLLVWYSIRYDLIEGQNIQKYIYITFWICVNIFGLKYLYMELQEYNSIINYFALMIFLIGFYVASLQNAILFILADSLIAIGMIESLANSDSDIRLYISLIIIIATVSIIIMAIKYYNYIKDKRARIALRRVGGVDTLTNLLNRRGFEEKLEGLWSCLRDSRKTIMAIMIDIDNFKSYNDTYGHVAGDQCLKDVAECIYDVASRKTDLVVRYGGEEFVVVFADISEETCIELAQSMQERVNALNIKAGNLANHSYVTVSMGIANMFVTNNNTIYDLIDKADEQLYYAKNSGRNRITMNNISVELNKIMAVCNEN